MKTKRSIGELIFDNANYLFMIILAIMFLYPFYYCLVVSLSDASRFEAHSGILLWPLGWSLDAYKIVFKNALVLRGFFNTVFYVVVGTALNVLFTSFAAYALSRKGYMWKKAMMVMILITMYFGGGLIPFYMVVKKLHLIDTPYALIIPQLCNVFNIIIMRTYFLTIPDSMEESARLDGANDFIILFRIMLPLAMPVVAVMIIYYGVGHWNDWFSGMIFLLKNRTWQPLQLILRDILMQNNTMVFSSINQSTAANIKFGRMIQYSLIMVSTAPVIMIYPFMQKYFIQGVMVGSVKE